MREIKIEYLIIHKPDERVLKKYIFTLDDIENGKASFALSSNTYVTRRQYTGLLDKRGVEIYEGDVVKAEKYEKILQHELSKVIFKDGAFCLHTIEYEYNAKLFLCNVKMSNIEVIGNIYENPELLKGEK